MVFVILAEEGLQYMERPLELEQALMMVQV